VLNFASDNYAGICPEALQALVNANAGAARAYGDDPWTSRAADRIREVFERDCDVYFVFNGTAANGLALASLCQSYHSVLCHEFAHVSTDECGGPEFFSNGSKLLPLAGEHGKLSVEGVQRDPEASLFTATPALDIRAHQQSMLRTRLFQS